MTDDGAHQPRGVGNLAKFFEAQASQENLTVPVSPLRPSASSPGSRPTSALFRGASSGPSSPVREGPGSSHLPPRNVRFGSAGNLLNDDETGRFRRGTSNSGSDGALGQNGDTKKRLSVSRLSQIFDSGHDLTKGDPSHGSLHLKVAGGMPKAVSFGNLSSLQHDRPQSTLIPRPPALQQTRTSPGQPFGLSRTKVLSSEELRPSRAMSNSSIEVPETVPVSQRIASLAASGSVLPLSPQPTSSRIPDHQIPKHNAIVVVTPAPAPPRTAPSSPAFKRARPPVVPSPASRSRANSVGKAYPALPPMASKPDGPVIILPDPRSTFTPVARPRRSDDDEDGLEDGIPSEPSISAASVDVALNDESSAAPEQRKQKRQQIIREMVDTEKAFMKDMEVLMEVYAVPASQSGLFSQQDLKALFSNLDVVISTSRAMLELLEAAAGAPDQWIGEAFNQMMKKLESTYCEYCKHNQAASAKLAELASPNCPEDVKAFLKDCQANLQGRTGAWDLGSLVIKPVQRVLKYPLLIHQLLKETSETHMDYEQLVHAASAVDNMAEKINEVKKRKETVEKYVDGKSNSNLLHGISKKWTRGTQQLKKATGLTGGVIEGDALYDALAEKFWEQYKSVQQLSAELALWLSKTKAVLDVQETIALSLEEVYTMDRSHDRVDNFFAAQEYQKACVRVGVSAYREAEEAVKTTLHPALETLLKKFKDPQVVMRKRESKLLDYERCETLRARGEQPDKVIEESADAYVSLHAQLIEELPVFLDLTAKYVDVVCVFIADVQAKVHEAIVASWKGVLEVCNDTHHDADIVMRELTSLGKWREWNWNGGPGGGNFGFGGSDYELRQAAPDRHGSLGGSIRSTSGSTSRPSMSRSSSGYFGQTGQSSHPYATVSNGHAGTPSSYRNDLSMVDWSGCSNTLGNGGTPPLPHRQPSVEEDQNLGTPASPELEFTEATALYDFHPDASGEVELRAGEKVTVLQGGETGEWWYGIVEDGRGGWFPRAYVTRFEGV
ncbi:hypothetical protein BC832DRAFT_593288 [Gaertneriomyces semiglobifer]|nr:hypothetical protein BC832DRAFT_593288 [Gaertneriomyces semiglobifer]